VSSKEAWRYERKFVVEDTPARAVEALLHRHPALFHRIYHRRYVNNLYLDGPEMSGLTDTVSGLGERAKTRVRWYGEFFGHLEHPTLERKLKHGLVGAKESYPLEAFDLEPGFGAGDLGEVFQRSPLPEQTRMELKRLRVVLANRYARSYFQSADGRFRFTVDSDIVSHAVRALDNRLLQWRRFRGVIVELKYTLAEDGEAHLITAHLPFRMSRNSKYAGGLDAVHSLGIY
jgi:hypothetical protein